MRRSDAEDDEEQRAKPAPRTRSTGVAARRVTPTPGSGDDDTVVEKLLPNGDLYRGGFVGSAPHGKGKYLWRDGCMYEGEWRRGRASGKGKFSWPSGATFEGEFRGGRMEGHGTFVGHDGGTYRGGWAADRRHGHGAKRYPNGDFYEGAWRRGLQDGQGRYVWRNGNQYVGEWRNGVISGRGLLIWANGNRYDGQWENGVPKGSGVFTWPDGSCYVGSWTKDSKSPQQLSGTFYPAPTTSPSAAAAAPKHRDIVSASRKRSSVDGAATGRAFPRICIWESDGEAGDITCDIIDTLEASLLYRDGSTFEHGIGIGGGGQLAQWRRSPCCFTTGSEAKKPGQTISKGHKNYDLMLNLQLGIRYSVGKAASMQMRELKPGDFDPREKFWTRFPSEGSKFTPPHQSAEFRWKDYCPMVFRHLRKLFAVDPADYMMAICGNDALRELSSPGKSGSFFYLTQDDRFMIKTVKKSEVKVLIRMLPSYYQHVCQYKNSLVTKFFGVHCVKPIGGQKVRFIVMGNLFCSEYRIHRRFDLKGSSHGRSTDKAEEEIDETTTLKDLDLNFVFRLQKSLFRELFEQIDRDCEFLEAEGIMDYSLLVGLHFIDISVSKMGIPSCVASPKFSGKRETFQGDCYMPELFLSKPVGRDILDNRKPFIRLGANMPARAEHVSRNDCEPCPGQSSDIYDVILYFGIIDILQDYDISKKLEHAYKSLQADPSSISAVDPKLYSKRFRDFLHRVFMMEDD